MHGVYVTGTPPGFQGPMLRIMVLKSKHGLDVIPENYYLRSPLRQESTIVWKGYANCLSAALASAQDSTEGSNA
jgi:hypothetical protein